MSGTLEQLTPAQVKLLRYLAPDIELKRHHGAPGHYWVGPGGRLVNAVQVSRLRKRGLVRVITEPGLKRAKLTEHGLTVAQARDS